MTEADARAVLQRFGAFADQVAPCFGRHVQRDAASRYLAGLVNDSSRKSMQAMHGRLSDAGSSQALQHFITDSPWAVAPVWARLHALIPDRGGILAVDDTGFAKQGTASVGVKRQYCGALGKTGNSQVGVSTALIGPTLVWPTSCELYLPAEWAGDPARRDKARVPITVRFREQWRIGLAHIRTVVKAGFAIEAVVADADYGTTTGFRTGLERLGLRYAVAVRSLLHAWASETGQRSILSSMKVTERLSSCSLCPRVRSPAVTLEQGPQGLRTQVMFTCARRQDRATRVLPIVLTTTLARRRRERILTPSAFTRATRALEAD